MKKKIKLSKVTLLAATSVDIDSAQISMKISMHNIEFGAAKLLCSSLPEKKYEDIEYVLIPPLKNLNDYSKIIFQDLHKYFETSHCLIVQSDSFVVNSNLWKDEFLKYDYIGGPWPNKNKVNSNLKPSAEENIAKRTSLKPKNEAVINTISNKNLAKYSKKNSMKFKSL